MSKLLFKKGDMEVKTWDVVRLSTGDVVGVMGAEFQYDTIDENTIITLTSHPVSSHVSSCYPEHIVEVLEHCGCFENQIDWMFKNQGNVKLHINLERNAIE